MKEGIDYFSPEQRQELAGKIHGQRQLRDQLRVQASEAVPVDESLSFLEQVCAFFKRTDPQVKSKAETLNEQADAAHQRARTLLNTAKGRNQWEFNFRIGSAEELSNLLTDQERFTELETEQVQRVFEVAKSHYPEIEPVRQTHSGVEPGGYILSGNVEWAAEETWEKTKFNNPLSLEQRMARADEGAVFFHCHPFREGGDMYHTDASSGDYLAVVVDRHQLIFCQAGVVMMVGTKQYSFEETMALLEQLKEEEANNMYDQSGGAIIDLVKKTFGIKTFVLEGSKWSR